MTTADALPFVGLLAFLMGLARREKRGVANIGFESVFVLLACAAAVAITLVV